MLLARLTATGRLDNGFGGGDGVVTVAPSGASAAASALVRLRSGTILLAGETRRGEGASSFAIARLRPSGALDGRFGRAGFATLHPGTAGEGDATILDLAVRPDGLLVAGGSLEDADEDNVAVLARFTGAGALDRRFGADGIVRAPTRAGLSPSAMVMQRDGKLVVAGDVSGEEDQDFALLRFRTSGRLDRAFGRGGLATGDVAETDDVAGDALVQRSGRIVVTGVSSTEGDDRLDFGTSSAGLARFEGGTLLLRISARAVSATSSAIPVRVACRSEASVRCTGTLRLRTTSSPYRTLGAARFSIPSGKTGTLSVPIGATGRLVMRRGTLLARAIAPVRDARGARGTTRQVFRLRAVGAAVADPSAATFPATAQISS
jgi:uncharacterized delta-60 repeat protein